MMKNLGIAVAARAQMEMPKPGPEHKKLDVFAGVWTLDGDMKASPMGPGGKVAENEKCEWMEGGAFSSVTSTLKLRWETAREFRFWDIPPTTRQQLGRIRRFQGLRGRRYLDLDERPENGRHDHEGPVHYESHFADFVQLYVRSVAGWNEMVDSTGREGD
jgi:hypothetical protein